MFKNYQGNKLDIFWSLKKLEYHIIRGLLMEQTVAAYRSVTAQPITCAQTFWSSSSSRPLTCSTDAKCVFTLTVVNDGGWDKWISSVSNFRSASCLLEADTTWNGKNHDFNFSSYLSGTNLLKMMLNALSSLNTHFTGPLELNMKHCLFPHSLAS